MNTLGRSMKLCGRWAANPRPHTLRTSNHNPPLARISSLRSFSTSLGRPNESPLHVAIIGSGPAGFYAARRLLSLVDNAIIDMYEQLPAPFGLVRYGVAPDHPEVKVGGYPLRSNIWLTRGRTAKTRSQRSQNHHASTS
jgi:adrenodoxin-NADP+ reductase